METNKQEAKKEVSPEAYQEIVGFIGELAGLSGSLKSDYAATKKELGAIGLIIGMETLNGKIEMCDHFITRMCKALGISPPPQGHGHEHGGDIRVIVKPPEEEKPLSSD